MMMKEKNRLDDFSRTDGESFEICFNTAMQMVKDNINAYKIH